MPFGILEKSPVAKFLLLFETKRAVVGGHDRQVVGAEPAPQVCLVFPGPQWRGADVLCSFEAFAGEVVRRKEQVLRAGFGESVLALVACLGDRLEGAGRGQVHDINRRTRHFGEGDRTPGRFGLEPIRPG